MFEKFPTYSLPVIFKKRDLVDPRYNFVAPIFRLKQKEM